jgi:hypothetical protein
MGYYLHDNRRVDATWNNRADHLLAESSSRWVRGPTMQVIVMETIDM